MAVGVMVVAEEAMEEVVVATVVEATAGEEETMVRDTQLQPRMDS